MKILAITRLALGRIMATRTRSFLTMLGVIIGVASLVALTSVVDGATSGITGQLSDLGSKQVTVQGRGSSSLTEADAAALAELPGVSDVATQASGTGTAATDTVAKQVSLIGVSTSYARTTAPDLKVGAFLPSWPGSEHSRTVVLSGEGATDLGLGTDDVGGSLKINGAEFTLVGILDDSNTFGSLGAGYMPIETARSTFAQAPYLSVITVMATNTEAVDTVQAAVETTILSRYSLTPDDDAPFSISNQSSLIDALDSVTGTLNLLLGGIASISLVVGGIGIMNIMLVSVRERTTEIGVRRAIGARRQQILTQFVLEAVILSVLGGVIGLGLGLGVSALVAQVGGWAFSVSTWSIALALGFSIAVGMVFGVWPARTAARLEPVAALRYE